MSCLTAAATQNLLLLSPLLFTFVHILLSRTKEEGIRLPESNIVMWFPQKVKYITQGKRSRGTSAFISLDRTNLLEQKGRLSTQ